MLSVHAALAAAGIPGYRGAFRPTAERPQPPDTYCVYRYTRTPGWPADDSDTVTHLRAFLHLYALGDPEAALAAIRTEMRLQGYALIREDEGYENAAGQYEILSEWRGMQYGA